MNAVYLKKNTIKRLGRSPFECFGGADQVSKMQLKKLAIKLADEFNLNDNLFDRMKQSRNDIAYLDQFKYAISVDVKKYFDSINVDCIISKIQNKVLQEQIKQMHEQYYFDFNLCNGIPKGVPTSNVFCAYISREIIESVQQTYPDIKVQVFVDDIDLYSEDKEKIERCLGFIENILSKYGACFHPVGKKNSGVIETSSQRLYQRLGLEYYRDKNKKLYSRLRPSTKRRYFIKLKEKLRACKNKDEIDLVFKNFLFGEMGICSTWPKRIYSCNLDRKIFFMKLNKIKSHQVRLLGNLVLKF